MSLWTIAWRSIQQRSLSSLLTGCSMALGVMLVVTVLIAYGAIVQHFSSPAEGYNLIVGAKGGRLQLVLNTVYHLSQPIENVPWAFYKEFTTIDGKPGKYAPFVDVCIPYCLGDSYQDFRVVGTEPELFTKLGYGLDENDQPIPYSFAAGRNFKKGMPGAFEGVIGWVVHKQTGLKVGDSFEPTHGITEDVPGHKHDPIKIVGVLDPTGTPNDRALFMNIEGFFLLEGHAKEDAKPKRKKKPTEKPAAEAHDHDHDHAAEPTADKDAEKSDAHDHAHDDHAHDEKGADDHAHDDHGHAHDHAHDHDHDHGHHHHHHAPLPESQREVTAMLIRTNPEDPFAGPTLERVIKKGVEAQAVAPIREIELLFQEIVGPLQMLLLALAALVVVVAGIGVMVAIYNSMNERKRDIAIMRSLGASKENVMQVILLESIILAVLGGLVGIVAAHGLIALLNPIIEARAGLSVSPFHFATSQFVMFGRQWDLYWEAVLIPLLVGLAALVGIVPALAAYRTDVAKALAAAP